MRKQSRAQLREKSRHVRQRPRTICQVFLIGAAPNFSFVIGGGEVKLLSWATPGGDMRDGGGGGR